MDTGIIHSEWFGHVWYDLPSGQVSCLWEPGLSKDGSDFNDPEAAAAATDDDGGDSYIYYIYYMPVILKCFIYAI